LEGTGKMLVLATGKHSQYGKLKLVLQSETDETPLQQKLTILAGQIGNVGTYSAGLTFLCLLGHMLYNSFVTGNFVDEFFQLDTLSKVVKAFIIAISIIVVAVPEGLPLAVTISLAFSVGKMK
jgi:Ca2+ transporting ATPase